MSASPGLGQWTTLLWAEHAAKLVAASANIGPCHDLSHSVRVAGLAEAIARNEAADPRLAALAGLVHDVGHAGPAEDHERWSAQWVDREFHDQLSENDLAVVVDAVRHRRFRYLCEPAPSVTAAILDDADNLDALGAHGVARVYLWAGEHGRPDHRRDAFDVARCDVSALADHWVDKLSLLPGLMRTDTGRRIARRRAAYLQAFLTTLERELSDAALPDGIADPAEPGATVREVLAVRPPRDQTIKEGR